MATCLQFALSNPVPGQEEAFNLWYGGDHLSHGVLTPGVLAGQRFQRADGPWPNGKHDYLMIWEFDDPAFALEQLARAKNTAALPLSPSIDLATVQPPTMWRRATVRSAARLVTDSSRRGSLILMLANAREGREDIFMHALLNGGLARLADARGVLSAELLTLADEQIRGNARKYRFGIVLELADEAEGLAALADALPALPELDPDRWLAPVFHPIGDRVTKAQARTRVVEPA